jgi:phage terminase small subunit
VNRHGLSSSTLTAKQLRFIDEYLIDFNATQAADRAGYSKKTAGSQGFDLLKKPEIQEAIKAKQDHLAHKLGLTREEIVREAARIAFSDIRKLFDEWGALKPPHDIDEDTIGAIASIKIKPEYEVRNEKKVLMGCRTEVRFWDKNAALEKLMKHLGLFKENNKHKTDAIGELLAAIDGKSTQLTVED